MYNKRRGFLDELVGDEHVIGLEIGPLDKPLVVRKSLISGKKIFYGDHLTTEDLKKKYKLDSSVNLGNVVDVDLISSSGDYTEALSGQLVDYIVASHVVEHVPNPIRWLQQLFRVLRPGGFLFLVVPDKRFTFDYQRPATTFGTMLEAYLSDKKIPSTADVFDHYSSAVLIDGGKVWSGSIGAGDLTPLTSHQNALQYAEEVHKKSTYHDVHVSVFTPFSFFSIIERLIHTELLLPEVTKFRDTEINDIEFFVCLRKPEAKPIDLKQLCLSSLPSLSIETMVSPYMPQVKSLAFALEKTTESMSKLELKVENKSNEINFLREELVKLNEVLARRSIKWMINTTHKFFTLLPFLKRESRK